MREAERERERERERRRVSERDGGRERKRVAREGEKGVEQRGSEQEKWCETYEKM